MIDKKKQEDSRESAPPSRQLTDNHSEFRQLLWWEDDIELSNPGRAIDLGMGASLVVDPDFTQHWGHQLWLQVSTAGRTDPRLDTDRVLRYATLVAGALLAGGYFLSPANPPDDSPFDLSEEYLPLRRSWGVEFVNTQIRQAARDVRKGRWSKGRPTPKDALREFFSRALHHQQLEHFEREITPGMTNLCEQFLEGVGWRIDEDQLPDELALLEYWAASPAVTLPGSSATANVHPFKIPFDTVHLGSIWDEFAGLLDRYADDADLVDSLGILLRATSSHSPVERLVLTVRAINRLLLCEGPVVPASEVAVSSERLAGLIGNTKAERAEIRERYQHAAGLLLPDAMFDRSWHVSAEAVQALQEYARRLACLVLGVRRVTVTE
jgi:hypothetical protein